MQQTEILQQQTNKASLNQATLFTPQSAPTSPNILVIILISTSGTTILCDQTEEFQWWYWKLWRRPYLRRNNAVGKFCDETSERQLVHSPTRNLKTRKREILNTLQWEIIFVITCDSFLQSMSPVEKVCRGPSFQNLDGNSVKDQRVVYSVARRVIRVGAY